jgi:hypothetical protein
VLVGLGLAACSLAQTPTPWSQLRRLADDTPTPAFHRSSASRFIATRTSGGEQVAILNPAGHRIAYDLGLTNVSPYASTESIVTPRQLADTVGALRAAHGTKVFVWLGDTGNEVLQALAAHGFAVARFDRPSLTAELVDRTGG